MKMCQIAGVVVLCAALAMGTAMAGPTEADLAALHEAARTAQAESELRRIREALEAIARADAQAGMANARRDRDTAAAMRQLTGYDPTGNSVGQNCGNATGRKPGAPRNPGGVQGATGGLGKKRAAR